MTRFAISAALAALAGLSVALPAAAQEREFCADRPGKGTPTCILDQGRFQLELGLYDGAWQDDGVTDAESWSTGDLLVRYGLTRTTEIQLGVTAYVSDRVESGGVVQEANGFSDLTFGLRHALTNPDADGGVSAAVAVFVTAPTGSDAVSDGDWTGGVIVPIAIPLDDDWTLSLSPEVDLAIDSDGDGRHGVYTFVAGMDRGFGPWALGAEVWVSRDDDPLEAVTQSTFNFTAVWTPPGMADAQIDFGLNFGLNDDSPDVEFGVGVARRF